jgi:hypothetical protein
MYPLLRHLEDHSQSLDLAPGRPHPHPGGLRPGGQPVQCPGEERV